jgi:osmotically-inducible protein OsmY
VAKPQPALHAMRDTISAQVRCLQNAPIPHGNPKEEQTVANPCTSRFVALSALIVSSAACNKNDNRTRETPAAANDAGAAPSVEQPSGLANADIANAVKRVLERDPGVDAGKIKVKASQNIVELTGQVDNLLSKRRAAMLAETVRGVRAVSERIELDLPKRSDSELQRDAKDALLYNVASDSFEIDVSAKDAVLTLTGSVQSWQESKLAERLVEGVRGVRHVENQLRIDYMVVRTDADIRSDIESRMRWDRLLNEGRVNVSVKDGRVKLTGAVGSAAERRRAYHDAWVNGTKAVEHSDLEVQWSAEDREFLRRGAANVSDGEIADAIRDVAALDPRIESARLKVEVKDGVVTLRGALESPTARLAAEELARHTVGVTTVKNEISIEPGKTIADGDVRVRVESALFRDPVTEAFSINVAVKDGIVTLTGSVDSAFERAQATDVAGGILGVKRVEDKLEIKRPEIAYVYHSYLYPYAPYLEDWRYVPGVSALADARLTQQIQQELYWSPFVDADEVKVSVSAGKATLTGAVDSHGERAAATENAFEGGAIVVDNRLAVSDD